MSLARQRRAVRHAEAEVVAKHQSMLHHMRAGRDAAQSLVTPGRIIMVGLASGYLLGRAVPALRHRRARREVDEGTDVLERAVKLVSAGLQVVMPLLTPLLAGLRARLHGRPTGRHGPSVDYG